MRTGATTSMDPEAGPAWRWWLGCWALPTGALVALAVLLGHSPLDLLLLRPFHDAGSGGFPLRHHWFFAVVLHTTAKWLAVAAPLAAAGVFCASWWWRAAQAWRWPALYLALCAGGTAGAVGIVRLLTNRYSPWAIDRFGGEVPWTPLFTGTPAPFVDGHGFPAAHAAGAFAWLSLWFVGRHFRSTSAWWMLPGLSGGLLFSWTQHLRGEHFPSHNLWTLAIAWSVAWGLAALAARTGVMRQPPARSRAIPALHQEPILAISTRSWLIGTTGMFAGCLLFSIDTAVEQLKIGPEHLHFWIECAEFTVIGPGLGMLCLLLAERLRILRLTAQAQDQAERERRFLVLGRMAASVAHEVRNPLHTLRLVTDELRLELPALRDHALSSHIDDSLQRIDRAVDLVYQLARPGSEDDDAGDLVATLRDAHSTLALHAEGRVFAADGLPERAAVRCSASGLRIMIDNLLRNALEATAPGDTIGESLTREQGHWVLTISNRGQLPATGTPAENGLPPPSGKEEGLGLGLTIIRHLAANAGGSLALASAAGVVTATLALPVWREEAKP
jgi:membrane-associated PAP2 superfamily phosphatase